MLSATPTRLHFIISTFSSLAAAQPINPLLASLQSTRLATMATVATVVEGVPIPGNNNNATFCTVPSEKQLFHVDFLDVAPSPLPVNRVIFVYLRGTAPNEPGLDTAELRLTSEAALASGEHQAPITYSVPLQTASFGENAHLAVRNATGAYGGPLSPGRNDVLADFWIPGLFLRTGWWTFHVESVLPDGRRLFCFKTREWLEHKNL